MQEHSEPLKMKTYPFESQTSVVKQSKLLIVKLLAVIETLVFTDTH